MKVHFCKQGSTEICRLFRVLFLSFIQKLNSSHPTSTIKSLAISWVHMMSTSVPFKLHSCRLSLCLSCSFLPLAVQPSLAMSSCVPLEHTCAGHCEFKGLVCAIVCLPPPMHFLCLFKLPVAWAIRFPGVSVLRRCWLVSNSLLLTQLVLWLFSRSAACPDLFPFALDYWTLAALSSFLLPMITERCLPWPFSCTTMSSAYFCGTTPSNVRCGYQRLHWRYQPGGFPAASSDPCIMG